MAERGNNGVRPGNNREYHDDVRRRRHEEMSRRHLDEKRRAYIERRRRELKREKARLIAVSLLQLLAPVVIVIGIIVAVVMGIMKVTSEKEVEDDIVAAKEDYKPVSSNTVIVPIVEEKVIDTSFKQHDASKYGLFEGYSVDSSGAQYIASEEVLSEYAVIIDAKTGKVIASRNGDAKIYPASMTKVLTLLVAVEHLESEESLDDIVTISSNDTNYAYSHDLSIVGYKIGEKTTVRDLLYGTILPSGGDAAHALAVYTAGSEEAFADLMNEKCREIGISDTAHFTNCSGIYDDNNYCTLIDMAMILKCAEENEICRQVLGERIYTTTPTDQHPEGIEISNWFIRRIEDKDCHGKILGAKTGFVNQSGCNAVSYQQSNDGGQYLCCTVNAWSSWRAIYDHVAIYDLYTR